jgi:activator of HSP90 ATPase
MAERIEVSETFPVQQKALYEAWLDSGKHSAFTGSPAVIDRRVGAAFTAWDGYISGTTIVVEPFSRIIQTWRTTEFPDDAPNSEIEVIFREVPEGTKITIIHTDIPDGQGEGYRKGWIEFYFTPMKQYFQGKPNRG